MHNLFDLDTPIIDFLDNSSRSNWTIREAVEGCQIFGGIGSGKTSGSGRLIAKKYLSHDFGGLVLTAKSDEKDVWVEYCRDTNRLDDLIVVEPNGKHYFNFIEYESSQKTGGILITENIVQVLKTVIRASEDKSTGKSDDPFWESALDMLVFNVIDLCLLAFNRVSIQDMYDIVITAPKTNTRESIDKSSEKNNEEQPAFFRAFDTAQNNVRRQVEEYRKTLSSKDKEKLDNNDREFYENNLFKALPEVKLFQFVDQFFIETYRSLSDRTRSIIEFSFSGFLFRLLKEPVYSLFCSKPSTFKPEDCLNGKIIIINLPVKFYHKVGRDCQIMFKYIWQRAMEKRNVKDNSRPVFLFADEAQHFLHEYDSEYQATARSSRIATVYISQNISNYHANMGGVKSESRVKSFLGTLGTKIFHSNPDIDTNEYASASLGDAYIKDISESQTISGQFSSTRGSSYKLERMIRPEQFINLKNGGPDNAFLVEGYFYRQGRQFPDGWNFRKIIFQQNT